MKLNQKLDSGIWHASLPFEDGEMHDARVDVAFTDGSNKDGKLCVEAHGADPSLRAVSVIINGVTIQSPVSGLSQQIIPLRADELSTLGRHPSPSSICPFRLSLETARLAEAFPEPRQ